MPTRFKLKRIVPSVTLGPLQLSIEAEPEEGIRGFLTTILYTDTKDSEPISRDRIDRFFDLLEKFCAESQCEVKENVIKCDGSIIIVTTQTLADVLGLSYEEIIDSILTDEDEPDKLEFLESIAGELGISPEDILEDVIYVEMKIETQLDKLDWIKDRIGELLSIMDVLGEKYYAKLIIRAPIRDYPSLEKLKELGKPSGSVQVTILGDITTIYVLGVHALRDKEFFEYLKRALRGRRLLPF